MGKTFGKKLIIFILLVSLTTCAMFAYGCGSSNGNNKETSVEDVMKEKVYSRIYAQIRLEYGAITSKVTYNFTKKDSSYLYDTYYVRGKVSAVQNGVTYQGNYSATVYYYTDKESNNVSVTDLTIGSLYAK